MEVGGTLCHILLSLFQNVICVVGVYMGCGWVGGACVMQGVPAGPCGNAHGSQRLTPRIFLSLFSTFCFVEPWSPAGSLVTAWARYQDTRIRLPLPLALGWRFRHAAVISFGMDVGDLNSGLEARTALAFPITISSASSVFNQKLPGSSRLILKRLLTRRDGCEGL